MKENGHNYFIALLQPNSDAPSGQKAMAAFILSVIVNNCRPGQSACLSSGLLPLCLQQLGESDPRLRKWSVLCLGKLWEAFEEGKQSACQENAHERLCTMLTDSVPEVHVVLE